MRVFVTGATGFVGSHMVRRLLMEGADVHILARRNSSLVRIEDIVTKLTVHNGDIMDSQSLVEILAKIQPDRIFHFANAGVYGGVSAESEELHRINVTGLENLLNAARSLDYEAFVNIGSSSEYGPKKMPMKEDDECNPVSAYGFSKLQATKLSQQEAVLYQKPIATFRIFSPYGPHDNPSRLIMQAIGHFSSKTQFRTPHKNAVRDYVYIDDVINALVIASGNLKTHTGEIFNLGSGAEVKVWTVLEQLARILNAEAFFEKLVPSNDIVSPTESPCWVADISKLKTTFPWEPTVALEDGLSRVAAWAQPKKI